MLESVERPRRDHGAQVALDAGEAVLDCCHRPERELVEQAVDRVEVVEVLGRLAVDDQVTGELDRAVPGAATSGATEDCELVRCHLVDDIRAGCDHRVERGAHLRVGIGFDRHLSCRHACDRDSRRVASGQRERSRTARRPTEHREAIDVERVGERDDVSRERCSRRRRHQRSLAP